MALALLSSFVVVLTGGATASAATPVYEIEGTWVNQPATISRGNPVVAEWRFNVNDAENPPSNEPVDNVVATFTVDKAFFDGIPDLCKTEGVDPVSSLNADKTELTCNFGTVNMGTAIVVQTPVVANGVTNEEIVLDGTSPSGETVDLPPILIRNPFAMDIHWVGTSAYEVWNDVQAPRYVDVDLEWSLRLAKGSDPGPNTVRYRLTLTDSNGRPIEVGTHPSDIGQQANWGVQGCTSHDMAQADGHPYSSSPTHPWHTNFVDSCTLTPVAGQPGVFDLTLTGINYDLQNAPTHDSFGNPLPTNWNYVASGIVWFRVRTSEAGSINLRSSAPTYTAPTGQTYADPAGNNTSNKVYTLPGGFSAAYLRGYTGNGGTRWDDTYRVAAGTTVWSYVANHFSSDDVAGTARYGACNALDTAFVDFDPTVPMEYWITPEQGSGQKLDAAPGLVEYYTGSVGNPNTFDCGTGSWSATLPADPTTVTAVRMTYPHSRYSELNAIGIQFRIPTKIHDNAPVGQDVWMFGSYLRGNGEWVADAAYRPYQETPSARYPHTNLRRDIVRIVTASPFIEKAAAQSTVTPGVPAEFTLTYSANGAGTIPETVDGYVVRDVLPLGMTYADGSADPAPVVTTDAQGRQVLTWTIDGVATNQEHTLTYQAVADSSIAPGTALTNTAVSSLGGESSQPVTETVTTTRNGSTFIMKTSDVSYIPNVAGDGVGQGSWTVAIESRDPQPQAFTDTIDILPYNGDERGTSFSGTYSLDEVVLPDGGTVYYTDADPATLSDDPADPSNGAAGTIAGNSVNWTTDKPENPTAIRVIGGELESGDSFSFQVVITTNGAEPQDVYVNVAQARAEHTALVMRTSAVLIVTDYIVEKSSDPEEGSTVKPGDTITYTVAVTQVGDVPAGGVFTDDMSDVLDDAVYNEDVEADIGEATFEDGVLSWAGDVPVGEVAHITYSVTVKGAEELDQGDSNTFMHNQVSSPGCVDEESCDTEHPVGYYTVSKTADPAPGATVGVNDVVTYKVQITQKGEGAVENAFIDDDLTAVLDDATFNDDAQASSGEVSYEEPTLSWAGPLEVGEVVDLTYSVTVKKGGDFQLANVVTSVCPEDDPDCLEGICVPAPDQNPGCETEHILGDYEVVKTSDPVTGSEVEVGDVVNYTVTVTHIGLADVAAEFDDDLSAVLDDATFNNDAEASAGEVALNGQTLAWAGDVSEGDVVTVTYSVTVTAEGDRFLENVVTTPGDCVPAEGQDEACTTEHINGAYTFSKTSDPAPGSEVGEGDVVTYTVVVQQVGTAPVEDATITDDLSQVAEVADWNDDASATSGDVSLSGEELTWTGDLEVGQTVTITYSVTVGDTPNASFQNVVTSPDGRGVCVDAADGNPDCMTEHHTPAGPDLPDTGSDMNAWLLLSGMTLLAGGLALAVSMRRRHATSTGQAGEPSDLL